MLPDPKSKRAALAGSPNRKTNFNNTENNTAAGSEQREITALAAAFARALARKAVRA